MDKPTMDSCEYCDKVEPNGENCGSLKKTNPQQKVLERVAKIIEKPSEYFTQCVENEKCYDSIVAQDEETHLEGESLVTSIEEDTTVPLDEVDDDDQIKVIVTDVDAETDSNVTLDDSKKKKMFSKAEKKSSGHDIASSDRSSASSYFVEDEINLDGCPWEIECTKEFWKSFAKLDHQIKVNAIRKMTQLARGEWRFKAHKIIRTQNLHLYTMTLTAKQKIVWQLAVTYSTTQTERYRKENNDTKTVVYSQIIRIWSIVEGSSKKMANCTKVIKNAVTRGQALDNSKVHKNLKVLSPGSMDVMHETTPALFYSIETGIVSDDCITIHPPAAREYTPLNFIKMDNSVLHAILNSKYDREQLIIKVSPEEHEIINMDSNEHILLLGRSGTGKTTCCLYRMWNQFFDYWKDRSSLSACTTDEEFQGGAFSLSSCFGESSSSQVMKPTHLQQVFITKSKILCSRFKNAFYDILHGKRELDSHEHCQYEKLAGPNQIGGIHPYAFPLFLTSHRWLLLLDSSLEGAKFFAYDWDGSLTTDIVQLENIEGSSEDIVLLDADKEDEIPQHKVTKQWRKVDSEFFASFIWPKLCKTKTKEQIKSIDPILVWMEIFSFIKGSFAALRSKAGFLSETEYYQLGKKMAPNFKTNREVIYACFEEYEKVKKRSGFFDDNDLVHDLYHRLLKTETNEPLIHQLYVDEVQDFTQAELALLLHCCHLPCGLFLTGDTAQSIMRSVSFRFCDLKSIFHEFWDHFSLEKEIKIPQLYTLTQNFRSHSGILKLAASVIDLLMKYFRSSLDELPSDQGMFPGPKPILLLSCSFDELALILSRETSAIEFGAKQAIIVRSEEAKQNLPDQLKVGIVLTVFEAKGLEFDDVLLYNFFSDSYAGDKWRVVTTYTQQYMAEHPGQKQNIIPEPRCLDFDEQLHKVLNSELKFLYTAITRAKCKLWIYDSHITKRAPMFHYFIERGLVESLSIDSGEDVSLMPHFAVKSSKKEWKKQGDNFKEKGLWKLASICYENAESPLLYSDAIGHMHVQLGEKQPSVKQHYLSAMNCFCECLELQQSAKYIKKIASCLYNMKLYNDAATLFAKVQDGHAIKAYHQVGTTTALRDAVKLQKWLNDFEGAIATCLMDATGNLLPEALQISLKLKTIPKCPNHTVSCLALKTAKHYIKIGKPGYALDIAQYIDLEERLCFYKQEHFINEVVELLQANERLEELYCYLKGNDKFEDGASIASKFGDLDNHICFVLMNIRAKLLNPVSYTEETKLQDVKTLHNFLINATTNFQEVNSVLAILRGNTDECFKIHERLDGYSRAEVFNTYINSLWNSPEKVKVSAVLKNLRYLLDIYNLHFRSSDMIKHFKIEARNHSEFCVPPLVLKILGNLKSKYKKDINGMVILSESRLKSLFAKNVKLLAENWLVMLNKSFGEMIESHFVYSGIKSFWKFLSRCTHLIEYKYYCEQFDTVGNGAPCSAAQLLLNVLNLEWTRYIPINHPGVQSFVEGITKPWMVVSKVFKQTIIKKNAQDILEQSVFQGSTIGINYTMKFIEFAANRIEAYVGMSPNEIYYIEKIVSELELVAIGLLGIVSLLEENCAIILPEAYQIVSGLFNELNGCNLLYILTFDKEAVWHILQSLIMILLGNSHDSNDGLLAKAFAIQHSEKNHLKLFGFERYFVLTLTLFGNLVPFLDMNIKSLCEKTFTQLAKMSGDNLADKISLVLKVTCISNVADLFKVVHEIQTKYSRGMVTYDFTNFDFNVVQLADFPQYEICYTKRCEINFKYIVYRGRKSQETNSASLQEQGKNSASLPEIEANFPPLQTQQTQDPSLQKQKTPWNKIVKRSSQEVETSLQHRGISLQRQEIALQEQEKAMEEQQTSLCKQETSLEKAMKEQKTSLCKQETSLEKATKEQKTSLCKQETSLEKATKEQKTSLCKQETSLEKATQEQQTSLCKEETSLETSSTSLLVQEETQRSPFILQQSQTKKKEMDLQSAECTKEFKMDLSTECFLLDDPVSSQIETIAISRTQESLTVMQNLETKKKDREKLIARAKEFRFQPGYKLSTEEKRCLDPSQEKIKMIKAQWGNKDI